MAHDSGGPDWDYNLRERNATSGWLGYNQEPRSDFERRLLEIADALEGGHVAHGTTEFRKMFKIYGKCNLCGRRDCGH